MAALHVVPYLCDHPLLCSRESHASVLREFKRLSPNMELWLLVHGIKDEKLLECIENGFGVAFEAKNTNI
mgnify:CR=1 FL=1